MEETSETPLPLSGPEVPDAAGIAETPTEKAVPAGRAPGLGLELIAFGWFLAGFLFLPGFAGGALAGVVRSPLRVVLIMQLLDLAVLPWLLRCSAPSWKAVADCFRFGKWRGWWFGKGFLLATGVAILVMVVTIGWRWLLTSLEIPLDETPPNQELFFEGGNDGQWIMTVVALLVAPLWEELAFRNGLFRILHRVLPYGLSAAIAAAAFAAMHGSLSQFPGLVLLALVWQTVRERTGSFWSSVVLHFYNNLLALLLMWVTLLSDAHDIL